MGYRIENNDINFRSSEMTLNQYQNKTAKEDIAQTNINKLQKRWKDNK